MKGAILNAPPMPVTGEPAIPKDRHRYTVVAEVEGWRYFLHRELYLTRAEVKQVIEALERNGHVLEWRIKVEDTDAPFTKGPGDIFRVLARADGTEQTDPTED